MLSGPAGGVVGYAATSYNNDSCKPVIGFDIGGMLLYILVTILMIAMRAANRKMLQIFNITCFDIHVYNLSSIVER